MHIRHGLLTKQIYKEISATNFFGRVAMHMQDLSTTTTDTLAVQITLLTARSHDTTSSIHTGAGALLAMHKIITETDQS